MAKRYDADCETCGPIVMVVGKNMKVEDVTDCPACLFKRRPSKITNVKEKNASSNMPSQ